jgi:hypothetical protein
MCKMGKYDIWQPFGQSDADITNFTVYHVLQLRHSSPILGPVGPLEWHNQTIVFVQALLFFIDILN